jgi:hypothetical protein
MRRIVVLSWCLIASAASPSAAQTRDPAAGMKIRYRPMSARDVGSETSWLEGTVARVAPDTVVLKICSHCAEPERVLTPLSIFDFQRHTGIGSRAGNAKRGALAGALVGVGYVANSVSNCKPADDLCGLTVLFTPIFAGGGALVGALIGTAFVPGRWDPWRPNG